MHLDRSPTRAAAPRHATSPALALAMLVLLRLLVLPSPAAAAPVKMRYPEGPSHGFVTLSDVATDKVIAHGELIQSMGRQGIVSRLVIRFDDGSLYDEVMTFTQKPAFRVTSYKLTQKGPAFADDTFYEFDRSGKYSARVRPHGKEEERDSGTTEIPDDVSNGMTSVLAKNLPKGESASTHLMNFRPKPLVLDLTVSPEGKDPFWVGGVSTDATRFLIKPTIPGVKGVLAKVVGKDPPEVRMWISPQPAPVMVKFEGAMFVDGPQWRIELSAPRWKK
jgi:hypothetical protein